MIKPGYYYAIHMDDGTQYFIWDEGDHEWPLYRIKVTLKREVYS
tara:strand:+ start:433 stop:564 length:132 start_codon:yes stop_codon:yes gene_type:complete